MNRLNISSQNRMKKWIIRLIICVCLLFSWLVLTGFLYLPMATSSTAIFDDFKSSENWSMEYQYGFPETGSYSLDTTGNGTASITHNATTLAYHGIIMEKSIDTSFSPNTWVHFRFKMPEPLLGANMYTEFILNDVSIATIGINGEQHYQRGMYCVQKSSDNEIFISSPYIRGYNGKKTDLRVSTQKGFMYSNWNVFSIKYDVLDGQKKLRFFVNGYEIMYRDIDAQAPAGIIDNILIHDLPINPENNTLIMQFNVMTDGEEYSSISENDGQGVRYYNCYADVVPAIPAPIRTPLNKTKVSWMNNYDKVNAITNWGNVSESYNAIWDGIYGGRIDFRTAILMGAIPKPDPTHVQWQYSYPVTYNSITSELADLNTMYPSYMEMRKRFVWKNIYTSGNAALAVYYGYIKLPELRYSNQWNYMSVDEKNQLPDLDIVQHKSATMQWDFVIVASDENRDSIRENVLDLVYSGRLATSTSIFLGLIPWQDIEGNCVYMTQEEIQSIREHPLGSPDFGVKYGR